MNDCLGLAPFWLALFWYLSILIWTTTDFLFATVLNFDWLGSYLNGRLYSVPVSKEMFVDHSFTWKRVTYRIDLQESTSIKTCLSMPSLAMGLHVTIYLILYGTAIRTGYRLDDRGVGVRGPLGLRIFSSPHRPDRLWGSPSLLSNGHRGLFLRG
jgi:hypothetical protein